MMNPRRTPLPLRLLALVLVAVLQFDMLESVASGFIPATEQEQASVAVTAPAHAQAESAAWLHHMLQKGRAAAPLPVPATERIAPLCAAPAPRTGCAGPVQPATARPSYSLYCVYRI